MSYIENLLDNKIDSMKKAENVYDTGKIIKVKDYIVEAKGLLNVGFFEQVNIGDKAIGYVIEILANSVIIAILKRI